MSNGNVAASSPDGVTWTERNLPGDDYAQWNTVVSDGPAFVAIAKNCAFAASSPDGATWTKRDLPLSDNWSSAAAGGGKFVVIAGNSNYVLTSP
jgi:hypothetical protein